MENVRRRTSKVAVTKSEIVMVIKTVHVCAGLAMLLCFFNFATDINLIGKSHILTLLGRYLSTTVFHHVGVTVHDLFHNKWLLK